MGQRRIESVLVLGGGLAGLAASVRLLQRGLEVTLLEKRPFLGGRAFSFRDRETGEEVDNGQHVFMGCCTYYVKFLETVGAMDRAYFQPSLRVEVVRNGRTGVLASTPWLGRLHLLPSFLRYPHIGLRDKLLALYGLAVVSLTDRSKHGAALDAENCYDWLKRHHQPERVIDNLWELIVLPTLNDSVRDSSADMALMVFQEGLLKKPHDAALGYPTVGLTSLNGEPSRRYIEQAGGRLSLGRSAEAIRVEDGRVIGVELSDGRVAEADAYVSALPFDVMLDVLPPEVSGGPFFEPASRLASSPIVDIHLWYDRPVMDSPLGGVPGQPGAVRLQQEPDTGLQRARAVPVHIAQRRVGLRRPPQGGARGGVQRGDGAAAAAQGAGGHAGALIWSSRRSARRSGRPPEPASTACHRRRRCPTCTSPASGPTPVGPPPWRAPSAAASTLRRRLCLRQTDSP